MKKITLIAAVAALTASSAIAATPQQVAATKATLAGTELKQVTGEPLLNKDLRITNRVEVTEEGSDEVTIEVDPLFVPAENSFYIGLKPSAGYYNLNWGLTGIRNSIGFRNLTQGADAFKWTQGRVTDYDETIEDYVYENTESTATNFFMQLSPFDMFSYPVLSAFTGEDEYSYKATEYGFYSCGKNTAYVGLGSESTDENGVVDWSDVLGVSPCSAIPALSLQGEYVIRRPEASTYDAESFDANGTFQYWYAYSSEEEVVTDIKIKAFGTYIPAMPSPYMLNAMWAWINSVEAKAAVSLPVKVYAIDEEGNVDTVNPLGAGELNYPEGATSISTLPIVELSAVDADGYEIDAPICVPAGTAVMVCIEGLDNENLLCFDMAMNSNCTYPAEKKDFGKYIYPNHAYAFVDCTVTPAGGEAQEISTMLSAPYRYYTDSSYSTLMNCSDLCMYFDVNFPVVLNVEESTNTGVNTANFTVTAPVEGGEIVVPVYCDFIIDTLISEGLVTASSDEWLTFTQAFDTENSITNVTINAAALPEGETGRTGHVIYEGYAIDFHITVNQGEVSGIEGIEVRPVAKGTKFYDMQGRQLQTAPAAGMYIESVDGKATKRLAR